MEKKRIILLSVIVLLAVACLPLAFGLGVTPAKNSLIYAEKSSVSGFFKVVGFENESLYSLSTAGQLGEYIQLEKDMINPQAGEDTVRYTLTFPPADKVTPGDNIGKIYVTKVVEGRAEGFAGQVNIHHSVSAWVPYPGYYVIPELAILYEESYFNFVTNVRNLGSNDIRTAWVELNVYDEEDMLATITMKRLNTHDTAAVESHSVRVEGSDVRKLALPTITESILSGREKEIVIQIREDRFGLPPGSYGAESVVHYDGLKAVDTGRFNIGIQSVAIINVTELIVAGEINRFYVNLYNDWNKLVTNAYLTLEVVDNNGAVLDKVSSFNFNLEPRAIREVMMYYNANRLAIGSYIARVTVYFDGKQSSKEFPLAVREKAPSPQPGVPGQADVERGQYVMSFGGMDAVSVVLIVVILLLAIGMIAELVILLKRGKPEKKDKREKLE